MGALEEKPTYLSYRENRRVELPAQAQGYFNMIHKIMRKNYLTNEDNDNNYTVALEKKSFTRANANMDRNDCYEIHWLAYIYEVFEKKLDSEKNPWVWANDFLDLLDKEVFISENRFQSNLFFKDFLMKTQPKILKDEGGDENEEKDILGENIETTNKGGNNPLVNNFTELSVTSNLGGSFLSMNTSELVPDDPAIEYKHSRVKCKEVVKIFADHLNNHPDHPINVVIGIFEGVFSGYVNTKVKQLKEGLTSLTTEEFCRNAKNESELITKQLQKVIVKIQTAVKLFYCKVIDYSCFAEEKDELINLVTSLIFKKQKVYDCMYDLYDIATIEVKKNLEKKFVQLDEVTPEDLGIDIKFCLNVKTLELQKKILADKRLEKDKKEKETKEKEKEKEKEKDNNIGEIGEMGEIGELDEREEENINNKSSTNIKVDTKIDTSETSDNLKKDDLKNNPLYGNVNVNIYANCPSRYTVNSFNNKTFNFPKLHNHLRDTIGRQNYYVSSALNANNIPKSYASAIELLRSIRKFRTPFEKMMMVASISDEITECVNNFWGEMNKYIKSTFLNIEADELMTIFLYIIIKSKMPELTIFGKMIKNFTSSTTRGTMIGYYYTTLEASIAYIEELQDSKELIKQKEQLKTARLSMANLSNLNFTGNNM